MRHPRLPLSVEPFERPRPMVPMPVVLLIALLGIGGALALVAGIVGACIALLMQACRLGVCPL